MTNNPFCLMFGRPPYSLIEREEPYQTIIDTFNSDTPSTFAYIISGILGSGKTVMLSQIANHFSSKKNWIVIDINSQGNILKDVSEKTLYEGKNTIYF